MKETSFAKHYLIYKVQLSETLFFYGPMLTESHMKVGLRTLITAKILRLSYHETVAMGTKNQEKVRDGSLRKGFGGGIL